MSWSQQTPGAVQCVSARRAYEGDRRGAVGWGLGRTPSVPNFRLPCLRNQNISSLSDSHGKDIPWEQDRARATVTCVSSTLWRSEIAETLSAGTTSDAARKRMICPRPRRHHERHEDPSLYSGPATASQDSLLDRFPEYTLENFSSPVLQLPAYDEVKYLPTYEETMQEVDRDRSNDHLLLPSSMEPVSVSVSVAVTGPRAAAPDTRTLRNSV
ncbi:hypothetical protein SKAU_G00088200 [Synaphobranchus kaupii]|uniref:Uncharacterized protein n=1 Tax=Synaphobranchus kaupii TaxID=118154 RepID=A0A9Q1J552_SYNKA|nr:hypothetical protein SKAU_G00088200 [Synaphobranchus kaupii]